MPVLTLCILCVLCPRWSPLGELCICQSSLCVYCVCCVRDGPHLASCVYASPHSVYIVCVVSVMVLTWRAVLTMCTTSCRTKSTRRLELSLSSSRSSSLPRSTRYGSSLLSLSLQSVRVLSPEIVSRGNSLRSLQCS